MKPIIYLDVDGVLNKFPTNSDIPADNASQFFGWAMEFGEIRWLTYWCCNGKMNLGQNSFLSRLLDIPIAILEQIHNPLEHYGHKPDAIDWEEHKNGRQWFWLDDSKESNWIQDLKFRGAENNFIHTRSYVDDNALLVAKQIILNKCHIPNQ